MTDDRCAGHNSEFLIRWLGRASDKTDVAITHAHTLDVIGGKQYQFVLHAPDQVMRPYAVPIERSGEQFAFVVYAASTMEPVTTPIANLTYEAPIQLAAQIAAPLMAQLRSASVTTTAEVWRRQIAAQQLLLALMDANIVDITEAGAEAAVRSTINDLHRHFREPITVGELMRRAGVGRWQYSTLFRRFTGLSPLEYVNAIRLEHARKLLSQTDDPLREIARGVGFRDEYYFSRRFTRFMGVSPKEYRQLNRRHSERIRFAGPPVPEAPCRIIASSGTVGDLLRLGIRPLAAPLAIVRNQVCFTDELNGIVDLGIMPDWTLCSGLQPDLAIFDTEGDQWLVQLGELCTAVCFENFIPPDERLTGIGSLTNRADEAANWIAAHEQALQQMWNTIGIQSGETAAAFVLIDRDIYVMAGQGIAATLYRSGGFVPCPKIARMIEAGVGFRRITLDEVSDYAADRFVLMFHPDDYHAEASPVRLVLQQEEWHRHTVRVHWLHDHWNFDDAWTRQLLIDALPELLRVSIPASM
ncbi:AraC family transcriptional regulator [Paenibacillus wenxiniae]|uniref:AraC family transcriptional regulator n=1 Tax=Paenibacillus wenxiniae TaxID=1636843 RepID=A0ABW4RNR1_9BACL